MSDQLKFTKGYFHAALEGEELVMEPYCQCGEALDEDYHCGNCQREVRCLEFLCADPAALAKVKLLIKENDGFKNFTARLEGDTA